MFVFFMRKSYRVMVDDVVVLTTTLSHYNRPNNNKNSINQS